MKAFKILSIVALLLLLASGLWALHSKNTVDNGVKTQGTVTQILPQGRGYTPEVTYIVEGKTYTYHSWSSQSPSPYQVGDPIEIYYDPNDPAQASLNSFISLWFGPLMLAGAGMLDLITSFVFYSIACRKAL
jgi:hypothetical protein